jgi:Ni,Fe-hydrogenase maturation factor
MEAIGLKVNPSSDEFLIPNSIKKRKIPKPVSDSTSINPKKQIPTLQNEVYKDIKQVIYHVGQAIDQLLGYLTHRDSKTALIMFIDQKEATTVIKTAKEEICEHSNFKKYVGDSYESSISYLITLPEDSKKIIEMEVMFFHFPKL